MSTQVVADTGKTLIQAGNDFIPGGFARTYAVHQVKRWTLTLDTITDVYGRHSRLTDSADRYGAEMRHNFFGEAWDRFQYFRLFDTEIHIHDKSIDPGFRVGGEFVDHFRRGANGQIFSGLLDGHFSRQGLDHAVLDNARAGKYIIEAAVVVVR